MAIAKDPLFRVKPGYQPPEPHDYNSLVSAADAFATVCFDGARVDYDLSGCEGGVGISAREAVTLWFSLTRALLRNLLGRNV